MRGGLPSDTDGALQPPLDARLTLAAPATNAPDETVRVEITPPDGSSN